MNSEIQLSDFEKDILENIRTDGCQVNYVFDPEQHDPDFSYSIGFPETANQPEVIVFGLGSQIMQDMIYETLRQCQAGLTLVDGQEISGLLEGFDCVAREVMPDKIVADYFGSAMWYEAHRTGATMERAFQIVWPGAIDGLYPWDDGVSHEVVDSQPVLYVEGAQT